MSSQNELNTDHDPRDTTAEKETFARNLSLLKVLLLGAADMDNCIAATSVFALKEFVEFLHSNRLRTFLPILLADSSVAEKLSAKEFRRLEKYVEIQQVRRRALDKLLADCCSIFRESDVEFLVLKGAHFAERFYAAPLVRQFDDVDILVKPEQFKIVLNALRTREFKQVDRRPILESVIRRFEHAVEFKRGDTKLDLHWQLRNRPSYRLDMDRIWQQSQHLRLGTETFAVLSDEYAVTMSILEAAGSIEQGSLRLKVLIDLFKMLETLSSEMNWEAFLQMRERENILAISVNVLHLLIRLFECEARHFELSAALAPYRHLLVIHERDELCDLVRAPKSDTKNRTWFLRCYSGNSGIYVGWMAISFLFRRRPSRKFPSRSGVFYAISSLWGMMYTKSKP